MYFPSHAPATQFPITCSQQNLVLRLRVCKHVWPCGSSGGVKLLAGASTAHLLHSCWSKGLHNIPTASAPLVQVGLCPPPARDEWLQGPPAPRAGNSRRWGHKPKFRFRGLTLNSPNLGHVWIWSFGPGCSRDRRNLWMSEHYSQHLSRRCWSCSEERVGPDPYR